MTDTILYLGNKRYSSWSMRGWLACRLAGLSFAEQVLPLDTPETQARIRAISPSGRVQLKLMASPDAIDIDLTDSAREPVDGSNLDCIIAARLIERLGARLRTQFTAGVGHWHHVRLVLASPDTPGREPATTSECS